jgi:hypothetical protein
MVQTCAPPAVFLGHFTCIYFRSIYKTHLRASRTPTTSQNRSFPLEKLQRSLAVCVSIRMGSERKYSKWCKKQRECACIAMKRTWLPCLVAFGYVHAFSTTVAAVTVEDTRNEVDGSLASPSSLVSTGQNSPNHGSVSCCCCR